MSGQLKSMPRKIILKTKKNHYLWGKISGETANIFAVRRIRIASFLFDGEELTGGSLRSKLKINTILLRNLIDFY